MCAFDVRCTSCGVCRGVGFVVCCLLFGFVFSLALLGACSLLFGVRGSSIGVCDLRLFRVVWVWSFGICCVVGWLVVGCLLMCVLLFAVSCFLFVFFVA